MGLMDKLNQLTQKLNNAADRLTNNTGGQQGNVNTQQFTINPNGATSSGTEGLGGLGNIYSTHENGVMESPVIPSVVTTDNRKLTTYIDKFIDNYQYSEYIRNWLVETGLFNVTANGNSLQAQMNTIVNNQPFVANYNLFVCRTQADADAALKQIETDGVPAGTTVLIGYINFNANQQNTAKYFKVQLIGVDGIQEINSAIDLADSKMPYITFDKSLFVHVLATEVHNKYKAQQPGYTGNTMTDMANGINASLTNIGEQTTQAVEKLINNTNVSEPAPVVVTNTSSNCNPVQLAKTDGQLANELAAEPVVNVTTEAQPEVNVVEAPVKIEETSTVKSGVSLGKKSGISLDK